MNIFNISQELLDIFQEIEENDGELTEELENQLAITQADFKDKVKSYTDIIKYNNSEIDLIDKEILRLKDLKESKKKAIDRLEKIVIWAINTFGDTTKTGGKFIDYGIGKVSIRNSKKVEVNTDITDTVVKNLFSYFNVLDYTKELEHADGINIDDVIKALKEMENPVEITEDELSCINASLSVDVNIKDLLNNQGVDFVRKLLNFVLTYKVKSNVSKTAIKPLLEEHENALHNIATIVPNQTLTIK